MFLLDQYTKFLVKTTYEIGESIEVLGNFLRLTYVENTGLAFSIRVSNLSIYTGISFVASMVVLYYIYSYRDEGFLFTLPLSLIFGGALGNLVDRLLYSRVVDFVDIGVVAFRWPVFNVADSAVSVGLVLFLIHTLRHEGKSNSIEQESLND